MNGLYSVAKNGLDHATPEDVRDAALAVWHKGFIPSLANLTDEQQRTAGYLLDRLSRFHCVDASQKAQLQALVSEIKARLPQESALSDGSFGRVDALAREWGMKSDLKPFLKDLMPYQTREFARSMANSHEKQYHTY